MDKEEMPVEKKSVAKRKEQRRPVNWVLLRFLAMIPLGMIWALFTFFIRGYSFSALVSVCLIGVLLFYNLADLLKNKLPKTVKIVRRIFTVCLCIGLLVVGVTECIIIGASFGNPDEDCDYIVVLGAMVRSNGPSVSLQNRIDAAYEYLTAHPDAVAVVSGGQGPDEPMSEAQCMFDHLTAMGIAPERVWMEDRSTSTWENLQFTLDLIEEKTGSRPDRLGVVSSEYHMFRASLFADACGVEFVGIPAHTTRLSQMINHFMREIAGVWHYIILGGSYD